MIHSSACQQQADTHPTLWDEPWPSKLHHVLGHHRVCLFCQRSLQGQRWLGAGYFRPNRRIPMSFYTYAPSPGVLTARELELIRSVYDRVISTDGFPADDQEARREIALYALSIYRRG